MWTQGVWSDLKTGKLNKNSVSLEEHGYSIHVQPGVGLDHVSSRRSLFLECWNGREWSCTLALPSRTSTLTCCRASMTCMSSSFNVLPVVELQCVACRRASMSCLSSSFNVLHVVELQCVACRRASMCCLSSSFNVLPVKMRACICSLILFSLFLHDACKCCNSFAICGLSRREVPTRKTARCAPRGALYVRELSARRGARWV